MLFMAGLGGGLCGSIAGLASLVSYPTLLALGLNPVAANVTNTVSIVCSSIGSIVGSRPELVGQRRHATRVSLAAVAGGAVGGALLLLTPSSSFEKVVPWLLVLASASILIRRRVVLAPAAPPGQRAAAAARRVEARPRVLAVVAVFGVYAGYFGAGAGVMMLALLLYTTHDSLPNTNAVKNVALGLANGVAALSFAVFGPVHWALVAPLGLGFLLGGRLGPIVVRRAPPTWLRGAIAVAGVGLAIKLGLGAYR